MSHPTLSTKVQTIRQKFDPMEARVGRGELNVKKHQFGQSGSGVTTTGLAAGDLHREQEERER